MKALIISGLVILGLQISTFRFYDSIIDRRTEVSYTLGCLDLSILAAETDKKNIVFGLECSKMAQEFLKELNNGTLIESGKSL